MALLRAGALQLQPGSDAIGPAKESWHGTVCRTGRLAGADLGCVVDGGGKVIWEGQCTSTPEAIAATLRTRAPEAVRIGLESGPLSAWHWHELRKLGLPVVCLDARHVKAALALQLNKSDRTACPGLAQIVRTGWYREVVVKDVDSHLVRSLLTTRAQLVRMRVDLAN